MAAVKIAGKKKKPLQKNEKIAATAAAYAEKDRIKSFIPTSELRYYSSVFGWQPETISSALMQHDNGQFRMAETLYQAMRRIPRIESASKTRANFIRTLPRSFEAKQKCPPIIERYNKFVEDNFDFICCPNDLSEINTRLIWFGFCAAKITWSVCGGYILPRVVPFTHYYISYDFSRNQYLVMYTDSEMEYISPNDPDWVFFTTGGPRPWLNGLIRAMAHSYALTIHALDRWMAFNDVEAGAIKVLHTPANSREQVEAEMAEQVAASLVSGDTFLEPEGYELKWLTSKGRGDAYKAFRDIIDKSDADISILMLGHNLAQEVKGGSLAAMTGAQSISRELFIGDLANLAPLDRLMRAALRRNFNPMVFDLPEDLSAYAATPKWGVEGVKDPEAMAELSLKHSTAFTAFLDAAIKGGVDVEKLGINWHEQAEKCGISLLEAKKDT